MKWFLPGSGQNHIPVLSGEDVMSILPSTDIRLPPKDTSQEGSPDHHHTLSTCCSSPSDSSGRVSTRIPNVSIFGTFWRRFATCHHERLRSDCAFASQIPSFHKMVASRHWSRTTRLRHSACIMPKSNNVSGGLSVRFLTRTPGLTCVDSSSSQQKGGSRRRSADPHLHCCKGC